jgi:hypothetical protein
MVFDNSSFEAREYSLETNAERILRFAYIAEDYLKDECQCDTLMARIDLRQASDSIPFMCSRCQNRVKLYSIYEKSRDWFASLLKRGEGWRGSRLLLSMTGSQDIVAYETFLC